MSKILGIDLGATNARVAVMEGGEPVVITGAEGDRFTPSVVAFADGGRMVGQSALRQAFTNPEHTLFSVKRRMGSRYKAHVDGKDFTATEISALILMRLKAIAEDYLGEAVSGAVITVPASFTNAQRIATMDAARIAGMDHVRLINEPTAAVLGYAQDKGGVNRILVYDLGGGTFNISLIEVGDGVFEVMATAASDRLGGDDFDQRMVDFIADEFWKENRIDLRQDPMALVRLRKAAERAKIDLSSQAYANVNLPYIAADAAGDKHLSMGISREQFEALTVDMVEETIALLNRTLLDAGVQVHQIDEVLLVGGASHIPAVREAVQRATGRTPVKGVNPEECAAVGAAIYGGVLNGDVRNVVVLDVMPLSLSVEAQGGACTKLIDRNTTIPVRRDQTFSTTDNGQTSIEMHLLQGENEFAANNKSLGRFRMPNIPSAPGGEPRISVSLVIDVDGILKVSARNLDTGAEQPVVLVTSTNLSKEQLRKAADDAERYMAGERKRREAAEAIEQADKLIAQVEDTIRGNAGRLSYADKAQLEAELASFKRIRGGGDAGRIKAAMDGFSQSTYEIFGRLYRQDSANGGNAVGAAQPEAPVRSVELTDDARQVIERMLPAIDNLERALSATRPDDPTAVGVQMTLKMMLDDLKVYGLEEVPAMGEMFDPYKHEAVASERAYPPGRVLEVFQKGYRVKDKIIRYAKVKVSVE